MTKIALVFLVLSLTCPSFGAAAGPDGAAGAQSYVRRYQTPRQMRLLEHRIRALESSHGVEVKDFEYSLPKAQKLLLTVRYEKEGTLDTDASAIFTITNAAKSPGNSGHVTITQTFDRPQADPEKRQTPKWQIDIDGRYNYSFAQGMPKDYKYAASTTNKAIEGKDMQEKQVLYSVTDNDKKFTLTISVQAAPMTADDKFNDVVRKPLK